MSAFIVSDKTINQIVAYLKHDKVREYGYIAKGVEKLGYNFGNVESCEMLAHELYAVNYKAVNARYDERNEHTTVTFKYKPLLMESRVQAVKSMDCWLYQCSESDVPETSELYKAIEKVRDSVCHKIVQRSDVYDACKWDA